MTSAELVEAVLMHPDVRNLTTKALDADGNLQLIAIPEDQKRQWLESLLPMAVNRAVREHAWDFATGTETYPGGTVAGEDEYVMQGDNQNCQDVHAILYGATRIVLTYKDWDEADRAESGVSSYSPVQFWTRSGRENDSPRIRLVGTPTDSQTLVYRYLKKAVTVEAWPFGWEFVLHSSLLALAIPGAEKVYQNNISKMITRYKGSTAQISRVQLDPDQVKLNRDRNARFGW